MQNPIQETPERVASKEFNQQCLLVCSQFYNDKSDKSLNKGCQLLEDNVLKGKGPISCTVKEGMDRFPTFELYLRDVLLNREDIVIDRRKLGFYKEFLGPEYDKLWEKIDAGKVGFTEPTKPITYESFRRESPVKEALLKYMQLYNPEYELTDLKDFVRDVCWATKYQEASKDIKDLTLKSQLSDRKMARRKIDATKMADDIMNAFPRCQHKVE